MAGGYNTFAHGWSNCEAVFLLWGVPQVLFVQVSLHLRGRPALLLLVAYRACSYGSIAVLLVSWLAKLPHAWACGDDYPSAAGRLRRLLGYLPLVRGGHVALKGDRLVHWGVLLRKVLRVGLDQLSTSAGGLFQSLLRLLLLGLLHDVVIGVALLPLKDLEVDHVAAEDLARHRVYLVHRVRLRDDSVRGRLLGDDFLLMMPHLLLQMKIVSFCYI